MLGQDQSALGGTLGFDTDATNSSAAGSYDVTPKGLTSNNYDIAFVNGKLTIAPKELTGSFAADNKVYDCAPPARRSPAAA